MKRAAAAGLWVLLLTGLSACPGSHFDPLPKEAERHRVRTSDGWEIALVRYAPVGPATGRPVLLCHGISANDRNMDLDAEHSLARYLASRGREAWTVSLRGTGSSDGIDPSLGRLGGYTFDTLWKEDLTAAITYVRKTSGAAQLDYVGHSMGGMLLYAYLSQGGQGIAAAVTLGSPTRFDWQRSLDSTLLSLSQVAITKEGTLPVVALAHLVMPLHGELPSAPVDVMLYNPANVTPKTWKRLIAFGIADISGALALQLLSFFESGRFGSADGTVDYRADMAKIRTPILVVGGKTDQLAIAPAVKDGYRALGGPKAWRLVGEATGARHDYGHMDLVVGERAAQEVWAPALAFLQEHHQTKTEPPAR